MPSTNTVETFAHSLFKSKTWWIKNYDTKVRKKMLDISAVEEMYDAIKDGKLFKVKKLIAQNPAFLFNKIFGDNERTVLYLASFHGRVDIVQYLLHSGADRYAHEQTTSS